MIKHINNEDEFIKNISNSQNIVIVDFFAEWCGPCQMLSPILEEISNEMEDINILKIDIDKCSKLALEKEIEVVPTILIMKNEVELTRIEGVLPKETLLQKIDKYNK